jgi:nucleotide-binding universal stress UspA family protein
MLEHILVPLDGSRCAALAVPVATDLARRFGSTLTLLHVVPGLPAHLTLSQGLNYDYVAHHARQVEEGQRLLEEASGCWKRPGCRAAPI